MAKVLGYYQTHTNTFLGPMTATHEDGHAITPRYVQGVCFGEYDTDTDEFVPHTNPMIIPKGQTYLEDNVVTERGIETHRTGIEEDKGADFVSKGFKVGATKRSYASIGVDTRDGQGKSYDYARHVAGVRKEPTTPVAQIEKEEPTSGRFLTKTELPDIDFDKLF